MPSGGDIVRTMLRDDVFTYSHGDHDDSSAFDPWVNAWAAPHASGGSPSLTTPRRSLPWPGTKGSRVAGVAELPHRVGQPVFDAAAHGVVDVV